MLNRQGCSYTHPTSGEKIIVAIEDVGGISEVSALYPESGTEISLTQQQKNQILSRFRNLNLNISDQFPAFHQKTFQGPKADMPVAGQPGGEERFYIAIDEPAWYRDIGYEWADSDAVDGPTYSWEDIASSGTSLTLADDASETLDIGFDFPFLSAQVVDEVHVGSNGLLGVGSDSGVSNASNEEIPASAMPNNIICPFWDNLDPTAGGTVHYEDLGTEPDRRFILQYTAVKLEASTDLLTFQVILYESGNILFQYKEMPGLGDGSSATIGVEGKEGAKGIQISNNAAYVHNEMAVLIQPRWELMFGADAQPLESSQRTLQFGSQQSAIGDHTHDLPGAPVDLTAEVSDEQMVLIWSNQGDPSVTSYEYWDPIGAAWQSVPGSGRYTSIHTITGLTNGVTYETKVRAINIYADGDGAGPESTVAMLVQNQPPVADAGSPQLVNKGDTVTLTGSATDEFPEELSYSWSHSDPRWAPLVPITDPTSAVATFTAPVWIESLSLDLTVTDRHGATHQASTTVNILNRLPALTLDVAHTVEAGDLVTLRVFAVDPDAGDPLTYFWFQQVGASVTLSDPNSANPSFIAPTERAALVFGLFVTDGSGGYVVRSVTMEVNEPGVVTLSTETPAEGIAFTASLTDPDGGIHDIAWQWASSPDWEPATESGMWIDIGGATSDRFTPGSGAVGDYLRATASYADARAEGRSAHAVTANVVEANNVPTFSSYNVTVNVDENSPPNTNVGDPFTANDADGDTLTYTLSGPGALFFGIVPSTGQIYVEPAVVIGLRTDGEPTTSLDYERVSSYSATVTASDGRGGSDSVAVTINVNNLDEPGMVALDSDQPAVGSPLVATLTDPDGSVSGATWQWAWSSDWDADTEVGTWADITGATSARYTPGSDDVGNYLRATANYADVHGPNKTASAVSNNAVSAAR